MYLTNISKYVTTSGSVLGPYKYEYREQIFGPAVFAGIGSVVGVVMKGYWLLMAILLIIIVAFCGISVYVVSSKKLTLKRRLFMDVLVFIAWISAFSIIELMYFTSFYGFHAAIILCYIPIVFIPLSIGIKTDKWLKTSEFEWTKSPKGNVKTIGFWAGIAGMRFAANFKDMDQGTWAIIILIVCTIINCCMSFGLLSIQKLYYMIKYDIPEPTK